jgi:hypothetical protein
VAGEWRKLHNEELHNLYSSQNIIGVIMSRRMKWEVHVTRMGEIRITNSTLAVKPEGKRPLRRPSWRREVNIRMDLRGVG